jgi:hypothetical protein
MLLRSHLNFCEESNTFFVNKLKGVAENAMSNNNAPHSKYDVFVSFRGEDIRKKFLSHLVKDFSQKQIYTFTDQILKTGDEIEPSLFEAIKGSYISLIIFSENYASSHWCLDELVKIMECKEKYGQIVIPIFYGVEPTDVRHQRKSYEKAFVELKKRYSLSKVQSWRHALETCATLSGFTSSSRLVLSTHTFFFIDIPFLYILRERWIRLSTFFLLYFFAYCKIFTLV